MPFFSSSSSSSPAASLARLPGFLRQESASRKTELQQLFSQLNRQERQRLEAAYSPDSPFSTLQAVRPPALGLNRYSDIVPFKHSQVVVGPSNQVQHRAVLSTSYINANRITAPSSLRSSLPTDWQGYIATQAPLPQTQGQFWKMVYEQNVHVIVCLTAVSPDPDRRAQKAERYWPLAGETDETDNDICVRNVDSVDSQGQVAYRHFEIWNPHEKGTSTAAAAAGRRNVLLVHYQGWPDHGVPATTDDLREILYRIRTWKTEQSKGNQQEASLIPKNFGPMVVHCSAGCGRTGTFCVIDTLLSVLEKTNYPYVAPSPSGGNYATIHAGGAQTVNQAVPSQGQQNDDDVYGWQSDRDIIYETLSSFREERMLMVQTAVQYSFCYTAVRDLCQ
ncbi:protein-tyrosine phosphatase-like protein [Dissophora ornata]|nr:Tyrosine-protein phosphatase non-receptor type 1 [Dissophora ornata]KAI8603204.1 protein-tyrosine phosphatase-like protein [Dissophora ornata]